MKNPILIVIAVIAVFGISALIFFQKPNTKNESAIENDKKNVIEKIENSRYIPYSTSVMEESKNTKRILFFYANWCPTCRPADKSFSENANKIPDGVTLIRVNYNDTDTDEQEKDLAKKYNVTYQHTYVQIDENGNVITKWNGGQIDDLLANIK